VLVNGLLPRGRTKKIRHFGESVRSVNTQLHHTVGAWSRGEYAGRVRYVDCGAPFGTCEALNRTLLPDMLHPSVDGYRLLLSCWERSIAEIAPRRA
jgi:lysophospholipase L1-like esterase